MRSDPIARQAIALALAATAALVVALLFRAPFDETLRWYLVGLPAIAGLSLAAAGLRAPASPGEPFYPLPGWWGRRRPDRPERLRQLEEIEHAAAFALSSAFDVHYRLRPHLVRVARHRLAARGLSLERAEAEPLLGAELWELVRPDREPPENRHAPGLEPARLRRVVERLGAL